MDCYLCKRRIRDKFIPGPGHHASHIKCWNAWHDALKAGRTDVPPATVKATFPVGDMEPKKTEVKRFPGRMD